MTLPSKRNATAGNGGAPEDQAGGRSTAIMPDPHDLVRQARRQGYVVRAVTTMTNGRTKVQHYASLHAAVKAEERARARGCLAVLSLCKVVPVGIVSSDELAAIASDLDALGGGL